MINLSDLSLDEALMEVVWKKYAEVSDQLGSKHTGTRMAYISRIYPNLPVIATVALFNSLQDVKTSVDG